MMNWEVYATIKPSKFEPERENIIAQFEFYVTAEDFLNLVIPEETRGSFKIRHINR